MRRCLFSLSSDRFDLPDLEVLFDFELTRLARSLGVSTHSLWYVVELRGGIAGVDMASSFRVGMRFAVVSWPGWRLAVVVSRTGKGRSEGFLTTTSGTWTAVGISMIDEEELTAALDEEEPSRRA